MGDDGLLSAKLRRLIYGRLITAGPGFVLREQARRFDPALKAKNPDCVAQPHVHGVRAYAQNP